ncbi:leucine-rich repeat-containing protein 15-like [Pollicipes pollicipes]|uniref:leucine-rich repeat-containing protein 15-like n=1 Tax=Pollicipes pollicipes TaxID=41117 RepID=UPI0018855483|nr:leucine-rich repeat-containing protein 15-like [Pollicipes pollicipes]
MALHWVLALALAAHVAGQQSCPSACYCDAELNVNCVGDTLWRFPAGIPTGVTRLELRSFVVPTLTAAQLASFANLTELKAPQNRIASVENGTFSALSRLLKLDLSQNAISEVSAATFAGLEQATNLDLSSNQLASCEGAFAGLSSLEQLTLRGNNLTALGPHTLDGLGRLQYLNVDSNAIAHIDVGAFQGLGSLAHLILSNNPLANLSRLEFFGSRLQYIDVSAVGLTRVPQSLTQYVRDLRLAKNNFTTLRRGDFDSYPALGLLVLDDSGVRELEEDTLGRHEYLMRLWMNGNLLERVPASLPPSLQALYLEENRIARLRANDFGGLSALEQLFLQRNMIETVEDCAFCDLRSLRSLDLQANQIQRLSAASFSGLTALESLDLSQNPITVIEDKAFAPFLSLNSLQLSRLKGNVSVPNSMFDALERLEKLEMFDSPQLVARVVDSGRLLHGIRSVSHLNVMQNQLTSLRSDLPTLLPRLQLLKLGGSRWNCSDPDILWLTDWMAAGRVKFYSPLSVRCRQPPRLLFKSVALLRESDFETVAGAAQQPPSAAPAAPVPSGATPPAATDEPPTVTTAPATVTVTAAVTDSATVAVTDAATAAVTAAVTTAATAAVTDPATTAAATTESPTAAPTASTSPATGTPSSASNTTTGRPSSSSAKTTTRTPSTSAAAVSTTPPTPGPVVTEQPGAEPSPGPTPRPTAGQPTPGVGRVNYVPTGRRGTMMALVTSMAAAVGIILLILAGAVCLWRYRRVSVYPFMRRRKDSSISYSQQKDEVSILHESCSADEAASDSHHGLSNVLYFMAQRGEAEFAEPARPRPASLLPHAGVDACPRAVPDAWATPSPDTARW